MERLSDADPLSQLHWQHWGMSICPDELIIDGVPYGFIPLRLSNIHPQSDGRLLVLSQYKSLYERILALQVYMNTSGVVVSGNPGIGAQFNLSFRSVKQLNSIGKSGILDYIRVQELASKRPVVFYRDEEIHLATHLHALRTR